MPEAQEKLLAEIRDLLATALEQERARSEARDAKIAASLEMQRQAVTMQRRVLIVGAILVLIVLVCAFVFESR